MLDLKSLFEKHADEFLNFERVRFKHHPRPDVCAFLMLHDISPHERDMVRSAGHEEIWLDADVEAVAARADEDQIVDLIRCGVRYDQVVNLFCMFV